MTPDDHTYRAHRFAITLLNSGEFALYSPDGVYIATGPITSLTPHITTGEAHYELAVERWATRQRYQPDHSVGAQLMARLGITRPVIKLERRI